jgi:uncharacterized protein involved in exopolysaccharide biosynthesis
MNGTAWSESEPGFFALRSEVARLFRRAARRRLAVVGVLSLIVAGAALVALRSPRQFRARLAVRVTEVVDFNLPRSHWTERELRGYVNEVALTNEVMLEVWKQLLWDGHSPVVPARAIEWMRDGVVVRVIRSAAVAEAQEAGRGARSAHVVLTFSAPSPQKAVGVLKALAQPIVEASARRRREEAALETRRAALAVEAAEAVVAALTKEAMASAGSGFAARNAKALQLTGIESALAEARRRLGHLEGERQEAERRQRAEKQKPGIDFEIAQEALEAPLPRGPLLATVAGIALLLGLPLASLLVGAFNPFVEHPADIRRLGIPVLGALAPGRAAREE